MQTLEQFAKLKQQVLDDNQGERHALAELMAEGYRAHLREDVPVARAYAIANVFRSHEKYIYPGDLLAGSVHGRNSDSPEGVWKAAERMVRSYGETTFTTNRDHFAPNYAVTLKLGIPGLREKLRASAAAHRCDSDAAEKQEFLKACTITLEGFADMIAGYGEAAERAADAAEAAEDAERFSKMAQDCRFLTENAPKTFRQALQLMWMIHLAFLYENRYAMALGRIDQFLRPYFEHDMAAGILTHEDAVALLRSTFIKLGNDVVNIAIAGVLEDGSTGVNELTYCVLEAVRDCNIPGPNLSARLHEGIDPHFVDECLKVIGTGLGYPALMNDDVNVHALYRHGYTLADARNYCMVGCIENFIQGKQPPWSDGRYNVPLYLEAVFTRGKSMLTGAQVGIDTGAPEDMTTMEQFMTAFTAQLQYAADEYVAYFKNENNRYNRRQYIQPFLSLFCDDCIARAKDIRDGGAVYPSVHGAGCMGIATVADSLAAIEKVVYVDRLVTLPELGKALQADFEGYESLQKALLEAPKYGNDDDFVDKYAVWYVKTTDEVFKPHRTWDGGVFYTAIASNVSNIPAGLEVAATPDGRKAKEPLSDAASPMHGMDHSGPTAVAASCSKPDYRLVSCGTVLNQKFSPVMFRNPELRIKLLALILTYFHQGGQEMQINSVSRDTLKDAMDHPEKYSDLVVRVSGFSDYYTRLTKEVQKDILKRTEHQ